MSAARARTQPAVLSEERRKEDVWIPSACDMCYTACGIKVHRVDGVVVKIEGSPDHPHNMGRLCAKGQAGLMSLYDPNRVKTPLRRRNPEKGIGVDPGWEEISWEEALDIVTEKLRKVREDDPRKLIFASWDVVVLHALGRAWASAFGTPNSHWSGYFCGNNLHFTMYMTNGSFHSEMDLEHCNYCLLIGNQMGGMAGISPNIMAQKMADARMRGMKLVVVDPLCTNIAAKADEWIPIRPGTDGALALTMANLLVNELGLFDAEFLAWRTNAPYLVGGDGLFLRDAETQKPVIWDLKEGRAKPFDAEVGRPALEGSYSFQGVEARPAFQLLKEHLKRYTPEEASQATTIPADTIRRLAREFGEAARIGSKIVIEGKELPYRPAAANEYRGAYAHRHGGLTALSIQLLNLLIGGMYVPGSHCGVNLLGPNRSWEPHQSQDGMIIPPHALGHGFDPYELNVGPPQTLELKELFPLSTNKSPMNQMSILDPEGFKLPYKPEAMILCRTNLMMNRASPLIGAETIKKVPFIVAFASELNEAVEFADVVLPDTCALERLDLFPNPIYLAVCPLTGYWYWALRQPVVKPAYQARDWTEVLLELAERLGFLPELYTIANVTFELKEPYRLDPTQKYTREEIFDRCAKSVLGPEHGLEWFKEHGYYKVKRSVEECYPGPFIKPRFPVYFENVLRAGHEVKRVTEELGIPWDVSDYQAIPDWKPCPAFNERTPEFDLYAINYKIPIHYMSFTSENPWLNELAEQHPQAYKILIHPEAAKRKGIKDGDLIALESVAGRVKGRARVTECIHPEVVAIAGVLGSWATQKPIAKGKGVHFNALLPFTKERIDWLSAGLDACIRVRAYKTEA